VSRATPGGIAGPGWSGLLRPGHRRCQRRYLLALAADSGAADDPTVTAPHYLAAAPAGDRRHRVVKAGKRSLQSAHSSD
jgi:hypothetical protein